jgi:hypothetical protein
LDWRDRTTTTADFWINVTEEERRKIFGLAWQKNNRGFLEWKISGTA